MLAKLLNHATTVPILPTNIPKRPTRPQPTHFTEEDLLKAVQETGRARAWAVGAVSFAAMAGLAALYTWINYRRTNSVKVKHIEDNPTDTIESDIRKHMEEIVHHSDTSEITETDKFYMSICENVRRKTAPPGQSDFLVAAVISYIDENTNKLAHVCGVNAEPCIISNSICAERNCIFQLRLKPVKRIESVYITTSINREITPGPLCREFLSDVASPDTKIILFSRSSYKVWYLKDLFPSPSIYAGLSRKQIIEKGNKLTKSPLLSNTDNHLFNHSNTHIRTSLKTYLASMTGATHVLSYYAEALSLSLQDENETLLDSLSMVISNAYYKAVEVARAPHVNDQLYPIYYATAVIFADGTISTASDTICVEYGCSVESFSKLISAIEEKNVGYGVGKTASNTPICILTVDHFGIVHSPSAKTRSFLHEYGYGDVLTLFLDVATCSSTSQNDSQSLSIQCASISSLLPAIPSIFNTVVEDA